MLLRVSSPPSQPSSRGAARSRTAALVVAGTVSVLVLGLAALVAVRLVPGGELTTSPSAQASRPSAAGAPDSAPRTGTTSPAAGPAATAQPGQGPSAAKPVTGLATNSLYAVTLPAGTGRCDLEVRSPRPPLKNSRLAPYLRTVVACLVRVFREPLAQVGFTLQAPKVKTYHGSTASPCGKLRSSGPPAFYCALNRTIYWPTTSDNSQEAYTFARLGYVALTAHEFGHHLQTEVGMADEFLRRYTDADRRERYRLSRRLELQAQCFEGVFLRHVQTTVALAEQDREELAEWHSFTGDEDPPKSRRPDHGSSRAQIFWLRRGLDTQDLGRCNTWSAPRNRVR